MSACYVNGFMLKENLPQTAKVLVNRFRSNWKTLFLSIWCPVPVMSFVCLASIGHSNHQGGLRL